MRNDDEPLGERLRRLKPIAPSDKVRTMIARRLNGPQTAGLSEDRRYSRGLAAVLTALAAGLVVTVILRSPLRPRDVSRGTPHPIRNERPENPQLSANVAYGRSLRLSEEEVERVLDAYASRFLPLSDSGTPRKSSVMDEIPL